MKIAVVQINKKISVALLPESTSEASELTGLLSKLGELKIHTTVDERFGISFDTPLYFPNPRQFATIVHELPDDEARI